ncbi:MAG: oligosaccharide flippase family protein [Methanoregula sp.]|nr:oligosaccharide flippase family protein [Methanoregula sp.]
MIKKYFQNTAILSVTEILLSLKGLLLIPILTKTYGSVNYGIWAQVTVLVSLLTPIVILGLDSAVITCTSGKGEMFIKKTFSSILLFITCSGIICVCLLCIFSQQLSVLVLDSPENFQFIILAGFVLLESALLSMCKLWYRMKDNAKVYSIINIIQAFSVALLSAIVAFSKGNLFELILVTFLFESLLVLIILIHIGKNQGFSYPDLSILGKLLKFGVQVLPMGYAWWILTLSNRVFIGYYDNLAAVGVFSVAYSFGYMIMSMIFGPIWTMYPPKAAELFNLKKFSEMNELFNYSLKLALGIMIPAIAGFALLGSAIFILLTSPEFLAGAPLVPFIALGFMFHIIGSYFVLSLGFVRKQIYGTISLFVTAGFNIILNVLLIPWLGILGAAVALCLSFMLQMIFEIWLGNKYINFVYDWTFLYKTLFSTGIMAIVVLIVMNVLIESVLISCIIGILTYGGMMIVIRAINPQEMKILLEMLHCSDIRKYPIIRKLLGINE